MLERSRARASNTLELCGNAHYLSNFDLIFLICRRLIQLTRFFVIPGPSAVLRTGVVRGKGRGMRKTLPPPGEGWDGGNPSFLPERP
ncbi:MAG: hypothetical protein CMH76_05960 [Nitrospinae bacterium]|nr:hypothetical protein [Nitrospinota bacterium]